MWEFSPSNTLVDSDIQFFGYYRFGNNFLFFWYCMWFYYQINISYFLLDQCSLPFIILIFLLSGITLYCAGTESNTTNYITLVLIILILLFVLFLLWNIFIFFIYYEFLVIILFILLFLFISSFFKVRSAFYFFIFSLFGSIFFFYIISILPIIVKGGVFAGGLISAIIFSFPFLVKLPTFPFAYWLPEVHTEANTSISVILAGLILKLGIFGIMRYCYITFDLFLSIINGGLLTLTLIIILIIMCSFFRFAVDLKKIIAFSSITHLNLTFGALITLNNSGILTAIITSFAHGLSSVALFLFVGSVIARTYSRNIDSLFFLDFQSRGILLFLLLFNLSFPLTLNFIGELLAVVSLVSVSSFFAFIFMLSSLIFTSFWFFIYNRKLPYYPLRLHLFSIEKYITIWLCFLLMSSGIFFVSLSPLLSMSVSKVKKFKRNLLGFPSSPFYPMSNGNDGNKLNSKVNQLEDNVTVSKTLEKIVMVNRLGNNNFYLWSDLGVNFIFVYVFHCITVGFVLIIFTFLPTAIFFVKLFSLNLLSANIYSLFIFILFFIVFCFQCFFLRFLSAFLFSFENGGRTRNRTIKNYGNINSDVVSSNGNNISRRNLSLTQIDGTDLKSSYNCCPSWYKIDLIGSGKQRISFVFQDKVTYKKHINLFKRLNLKCLGYGNKVSSFEASFSQLYNIATGIDVPDTATQLYIWFDREFDFFLEGIISGSIKSDDYGFSSKYSPLLFAFKLKALGYEDLMSYQLKEMLNDYIEGRLSV